MYRPPVNPGYDLIGAAIADGLARATGSMRSYRMEDREENRYKAQQERQARMDAVAEAERRRAQEIQDAELGVVGESEAYADPIRAALIDRSNPAAPRPDTRPMVGGERQDRERTLREGVVRAGGRFIDPRRSLGFRREEIQRETVRNERYRQLSEAADRLMGLDPKMTRQEAVARAAGLSTTSPLTRLEAIAQRRQDLELADEFNRRESDRSLRNQLTVRREGRKDESATMGRARRQNEAEGYALTQAIEAVRTNPHGNPAGRVRVQLRRLLGGSMTEGEIQELAARAVMTVQNQGMREQDFTRRNEDDDWEDDAKPAPTPSTETPQLKAERARWDELRRKANEERDPVKRVRAITALGDRP